MMIRGSIWFAIQTNRLKEVGGGYAKNWKELIQATKSRLENSYHIPSLPKNLRNTEEVFKVTETVKSESVRCSACCW